MCYDNYWPPPVFEYVDLWQYSDQEIHDYIKVLCDFMNERNQQVKESVNEDVPKEISVDDIPF